MRKSVERKKEIQDKATMRKNFWHKHALFLMLVATAVSLSALFLTYSDWKQVSEARELHEAQIKSFAESDERIKLAVQKKIEAAKKAEAEAKAQAETEAIARRTQAATNPLGTAASTSCNVKNPSLLTVVINKKHCFSPIDWAPSDLLSVDGFLIRSEAAARLSAMMQVAASSGAGFEPSSAYRSYANQVTTYNHWVTVNGSPAAADTVSARPGFSEHQTGLAVDLKVGGCALECFAGSAAYQWLSLHAGEYGYIERYPPGLTSITGYSPEAWHWRYVGTTVASDMKTKGIQTLEQYFGVPGGDYAR